eukprot:7192624-Ditylum_brightwellii.AAC.1
MKELNMMHDHFLFLWHNFHVYTEEEIDVQGEEDEDANKESAGSAGIVRLAMEIDQKNQDDAAFDVNKIIDEENNKESGENMEGSPGGNVWYFKLKK